MEKKNVARRSYVYCDTTYCNLAYDGFYPSLMSILCLYVLHIEVRSLSVKTVVHDGFYPSLIPRRVVQGVVP